MATRATATIAKRCRQRRCGCRPRHREIAKARSRYGWFRSTLVVCRVSYKSCGPSLVTVRHPCPVARIATRSVDKVIHENSDTLVKADGRHQFHMHLVDQHVVTRRLGQPSRSLVVGGLRRERRNRRLLALPLTRDELFRDSPKPQSACLVLEQTDMTHCSLTDLPLRAPHTTTACFF